MDAQYRKHNDHSHNSSTYHKKDGTNVRAILKREAVEIIEETVNGQSRVCENSKAHDSRQNPQSPEQA